MTLTPDSIKEIAIRAGVRYDRLQAVTNKIWEGVQLYREYKQRRYLAYKDPQSEGPDRFLRRPSSSHLAPLGRNNQSEARTVLISSICRAWFLGIGTEPTLNHKNSHDTDFRRFASEILIREGIGKHQQHLEE